MNDRSHDLSKLRDNHKKWLSKLGILDKPWLLLGSAPDPTLPEDLLEQCARVDINNAGKTANALGLRAADLTFRKKKKSWDEHPELRTRGLLWLHTSPLWIMHLKLRFKPHKQVDSLNRATKVEREAIVNLISGGLPAGTGELDKVTNGVAATCYALYMGVPKVILAGFSLSKMGHSYDQKQSVRRQISEDRYVLQKLSSRPDVFTTEEDFSVESGITLIG